MKRLNDIAFVEQAFYTSNEEGMGVSPNLYEGQNQMPRRPGTRDAKTTNRTYVAPLIDPMAELHDSFQIILPSGSTPNGLRKSGSHSPPARFGGNGNAPDKIHDTGDENHHG